MDCCRHDNAVKPLWMSSLARCSWSRHQRGHLSSVHHPHEERRRHAARRQERRRGVVPDQEPPLQEPAHQVEDQAAEPPGDPSPPLHNAINFLKYLEVTLLFLYAASRRCSLEGLILEGIKGFCFPFRLCWSVNFSFGFKLLSCIFNVLVNQLLFPRETLRNLKPQAHGPDPGRHFFWGSK